MIFLMWAVFTIEFTFGLDFGFLGVVPRTLNGLLGVIGMPFVHGDIGHLVSNTFPLLFLGTTLYYFYSNIAGRVLILCILLTGVGVWLFARTSNHIGASGAVYGIASFLIFYGFFRRSFISILISIIIVLTYGSIFYGVLPLVEGVSWEAHLIGALVGLGCAVYYGRKKISD